MGRAPGVTWPERNERRRRQLEVLKAVGRLRFGEVREASPGAHGGFADKKTVAADLREHCTQDLVRFEPPRALGDDGYYVDNVEEAEAIHRRWRQAVWVESQLPSPTQLEGLAYRQWAWARTWRRRLDPYAMEALDRAARVGHLPVGYRLGRPSWWGQRLWEEMEGDPFPGRAEEG